MNPPGPRPVTPDMTPNGLLVLAPWVLFGVLGAIFVLCRREERARVGAEVVTCLIVALGYVFFLAWPSVYEGDLKTEELRERYRARFDRAYVYDIGWDEPFPWTR